MIQFHETRRGQIFFEQQLPSLIHALERIADGQSGEGESSNLPFPLADKETRARLIAVIDDDNKAEAFANAFRDAFRTDEEDPVSMGYHMARAILNNNIEEFLVAIVGWTSKSLLNIAETGNAEGEDSISPNATLFR